MIEVRNAHHHQSQNDAITAISIGDVVIVHEENQPREKWRVAKILDFITGADSCIRGAVVEVRYALWQTNGLKKQNVVLSTSKPGKPG